MKRIPAHVRGSRILGLTFDGRPIVEPPAGSSLVFAAATGGKTTCISVPMVNHPHRISLKNIADALIDEPKDSSRNSYWRQRSREIIDLGMRTASHKPEVPTNARRPRKAGMIE